MRSAKNLQYMQQHNSDCPQAFFESVLEQIESKRCVLRFDYDGNKETIFKDGALLSNKALKDKSVATNGGTDSCVLDDHAAFGNTDFVFTRPMFLQEDEPIRRLPDKFHVPFSPTLAERSWLSFNDWADYRGGGKQRDEYLGNLWKNTATADTKKSFLCDFFMGDDIPKAITLKSFEAAKTAVLLFQDSAAPEGFDVQKATEFLTNIRRLGSRGGWFDKNNILQLPLEQLRLNEKQVAYLQSEKSAAFVKTAVDTTLDSLLKLGELKVPRFISLDGAAIPTDGKVIQLKSSETLPDRLRFERDGNPVASETILVPRDSRLPTSQTYPDRC